MSPEPLTLRAIRARPVILELERPIVSRIATIAHWPVVLVGLETDQGITGKAYLEPYLPEPPRENSLTAAFYNPDNALIRVEGTAQFKADILMPRHRPR